MIPAEILKKVKRVELRTRRLVNTVFSGEYHSVFKGQGMAFSEVREYRPGDEIRTIDWNVTARMGEPFVKVFDEERELSVMLVVDASGSGDFGTVEQMKGEIAVEICALLAFSAIQNNDRVGLIIFTDEVETYIPPKKGKKHVLRVIRELLYFKPERRGTDVAEALNYLNRLSLRRSVVFVVSDFRSSPFESPLRVAKRKHDVIGISIRDPREEALPDVGIVELEDAETGEEVLLDTSDAETRKLFEQDYQRVVAEREDVFRSIGVDTIDVTTAQPYADPLMRFFKMRGTKIRA
ncbi:DUF58 domain-containing protein [bacterium]|jgi:uncharacterized protein (DUF58 family)|nr:DUF58 domain-containing protein [Gemmatimonadota bacterium]MCH2664497.1 DUF58 domain-containing protein [bacterium]HCK12200.1 DUF58 domain-containing protein [Candidatus Latescibacterota bacterium]|tara:strand:+ start:657 stop:1538 length:882 start_codon:yes stop_codon:yes gene_type:complete